MPTTHYVAAIWADALIERLEAYVAAQGVYSADAIWTYLGTGEDLLATPPRESFLVVSVASLSPHQKLHDGGGRAMTQLDGNFTLTQYQRLLSDRETQSARLLKDRSKGLLQALRKLVKVLQMWDAKDAANESPLAEPGRLVGQIRFNPRKTPSGWASVESTWELKFRADLA